MIKRWYEIICDICRWAEHFQGNIHLAERQYRYTGDVVTSGKKHYCDQTCYSLSKSKEKKQE